MTPEDRKEKRESFKGSIDRIRDLCSLAETLINDEQNLEAYETAVDITEAAAKAAQLADWLHTGD